MRLTGLLRGVRRPEGEFTTQGRELDIVIAAVLRAMRDVS